MLLIICLVFIAMFAVVVLVMSAVGHDAAQDSKKTLAAFDSVMRAPTTSDQHDEVLDIRRHERLSAIPWLNRWLVDLDVAPKVRLLLYQAELSWTVGRLALMCCASAVVLGYSVYLRTDVPLVSLFMGGVGASLPYLYVVWKKNKRMSRFEQKLPDALDLIVSSLRAGHSLISAIGIVSREASAPIDREFRICFDEQNFGLDFRVALDNLAQRVPLQDVKILTAAILIQRESGGNLAEVLEKVAYIIRERFRLKKQIQVHTAQGRLTGWILSVLPVILGMLMYLVDPEHVSLLWKRPVGLNMLYTATVMTCIGALIIRKIVRIDV